MHRQPIASGIVAALLLVAAPLRAQERTTVGGYGEIHYHNQTGSDTPGSVNLRRFVVYLAHTFDDRLSFHSELEVEDAKVEASDPVGEVEIEQAFLDYRLASWATLRTGLVLVPIGIINETHEPPTFNGVDRPAFDRDVIPTTWREIGVGAAGALPGGSGLTYRVYLVNGLNAEGFSKDAGLREGSGEGQEAGFANPSFTGCLEWSRPGLTVGGSFWYGGTSADDPLLGTGAFAASVTVLALDARYEADGLALRGAAANISVRDAAAIEQRFGSEIGSRLAGGYAEVAYDLLRRLAPTSSQHLSAFVRHERYDLEASVPATVTRDRSLARRVTTFGLTYKPTWNTAFKGDYQLVRNVAGVDEYDVFSLGIGYQF